ncbi:hypothetical protein P3S68_026705 [Capsicum galapagoense]
MAPTPPATPKRNESDRLPIIGPLTKVNGSSPERIYGVIDCKFNTEDKEIPSNDHIILPARRTKPTLVLKAPKNKK